MLMNNQVINVSRGEIIFSQRNFAKRNGMSRQQLRTFLKKLEKTNMIRVKSNPEITHAIILGYNTYNDFKSNHSNSTHNPIIRKKESKNKEINKDFELFWNSYPKKIGKKKVEEKFLQNKYPIDDILKALEIHKQSDQWQNPQYIPNPETYLNQEKWNDILINNKDDEIEFVYKCNTCSKVKDKSEYHDLFITCCDKEVKPIKEYV
jgi:hypothetical protein